MNLEMKIKQGKLDWRVLNLRFPKNCKNNLFKRKQASGKVPQLFLEAEGHTLV